MKKVLVITLLTAALVLAGCGGGGSNNVTTAGPANFTLNTGDALNDQILKFELTISSVTLTGSGGTATTGNLLSKPAEVEFVHEAGTFEPLALANVPPGTYSGATLSVSNPEVVVLNASNVPTEIPATLTASTVTITFSTAITVSTSTNTVVNFDLDLAGSVTLTGNPPTAATITPKFNVTTTTVNANNEDDNSGEIEDVHGSITNITAPNFTIQSASTTITFATDANTKFTDGITQLSDLKVGDIVEVDGVTRSDGSKLATKVEREEGSSGEEVEGVISAVTGAPATALTIAHQVDSSGQANPPVTVNVNLTTTTQYVVRADKLNLGSLPAFDASHIGKGQRVEIDTTNAAANPLSADKVKLREQAIVGTVAATPTPTATSFTLNVNPVGAFGLLSGVSSVAVTVPSGATLNVTPTAGATVKVRGLIFVNGTTYTMIATREDGN